ncbi:glycosyltransferase family 4 protein [Methanolobus sp. WCC4]|uniref:glycosyltransferase family 4 protein n=1 Tax=Methanolobus sp. WCC4 TaxID=3125784 RepID=UPI0030FB5E80
MNKKIKVTLKSASGSVTHSAYQELFCNPPSNCSYYYEKQTYSDRIMSATSYYLPLPSIGYIKENTDLVHSHQQLIVNKIPFVIDFEHISALVHFNHKKLKSSLNKRIIEKFFSSKNCMHILPWSVAAERSMQYLLDTKSFKEKIKVVYPAMHSVEITKKKSNEITILFVGRLFLRKGGLEVLKAFELLNQKYDIRLVVVSQVPDELKAKYEHYHNIEFYNSIPRTTLLNDFFPKGDIFLFPTYYDTFGMVFLEAMAYGMPIVTLDGFGTSEIIEDDKNGFLIKPYSKKWFDTNYLPHPEWGDFSKLYELIDQNEQKRIVSEIVDKVSSLIENDSMREKMGKYGKKMVDYGKFSIEKRNKTLTEIYEMSI